LIPTTRKVRRASGITASSEQPVELLAAHPGVRRMLPSVPFLIGWLPWMGMGIASGMVGWRRM